LDDVGGWTARKGTEEVRVEGFGSQGLAYLGGFLAQLHCYEEDGQWKRPLGILTSL